MMAEENSMEKEKKVRPDGKQKPTKLEKWFRTMHRIERVLLRPFFRFELHGEVKKYNDGACIFVGNHYSDYDVVYPCMMTDRPVHFVAKRQLWEHKITRWFAEKCECVPVNRDGTDVKAIMQMMRLLKNGSVINIFPEGTRNRSYDSFLPFKGGAAAISVKTGAPIVPFAIVSRTRIFRKTHVIMGAPMEFTEFYGKRITQEDIDLCDDKIREVIWNMRAEFIEKNGCKIK